MAATADPSRLHAPPGVSPWKAPVLVSRRPESGFRARSPRSHLNGVRGPPLRAAAKNRSPKRHGLCSPAVRETTRDPDLEWLLCEAPALLGERSGHAAVVAALERGPGGAQSTDGAWDAVERARPHAARFRRLRAAWTLVAPDHRRLLVVHYTAPASRAAGVPAQLGELARAALALCSDRRALELACGHPSGSGSAKRIAEARGLATRALRQAHRAWSSARRAEVLTWLGG